MMRAASPVTVGAAMLVPQMVPYAVSLVSNVDVTPPSPLLWQPGAEMSGLMRPSSTGPQLLNEVIESSLELTAPTVMWFFAPAGGAVVAYVFPQVVVCRSFPFAQMIDQRGKSDVADIFHFPCVGFRRISTADRLGLLSRFALRRL